MTIISGPVKSVDCHPDVSETTAAYSASVIDVFEARPRLSSESEGTAKEAALSITESLLQSLGATQEQLESNRDSIRKTVSILGVS